MKNEVSSLLNNIWLIIINYKRKIAKKMYKNKDGIYIYNKGAYKGIKNILETQLKKLQKKK